MNAHRSRTSADPSEDEFFRLFTLYQRRIYAFIRSTVPNSSDADDVFQETSMRLWDQRAKYVPGSNFIAWACTIARYQVATYRKANLRQKLHYSEAFVELVAQRMEEEDVEARQRALQRCMRRLSPQNARLLLAFYAPDSVAKDVAEQFGCSIDAVYQTASRLRRVLHDCIRLQLKPLTPPERWTKSASQSKSGSPDQSAPAPPAEVLGP